MKKHKKEILDELKDIAPFLSEMEKKDGFQVPENYFNELSDKILAELDLSEKVVAPAPRESNPSWWDQLLEQISILFQPRVAVGFGVVLVLMVSLFLFTNDGGEAQQGVLADVTAEEASQYILDHIDDFEEELLMEALADVEGEVSLDEMNFDEAELNEYLDELTDSDLEELL